MNFSYTKPSEAISNTLLLCANKKELSLFLEDIFTNSELEKAYERIHIIDCLDQGLSQRKTLGKVGSAIATVTRGGMLMKKPNVILPKILKKARTQNWWKKLFWCA